MPKLVVRRVVLDIVYPEGTFPPDYDYDVSFPLQVWSQIVEVREEREANEILRTMWEAKEKK